MFTMANWDVILTHFCLVTPLDVVKTRLQTQELSGVRHLDGTLVRIRDHDSVCIDG